MDEDCGSPLAAEINGLLSSRQHTAERQGLCKISLRKGTMIPRPQFQKGQERSANQLMVLSSGRSHSSDSGMGSSKPLFNIGTSIRTPKKPVHFHPISSQQLRVYTMWKQKQKQRVKENGKRLTSQEAFSMKMSQNRWLAASNAVTDTSREHVKDCSCLKCRKLKSKPSSAENCGFSFKMIGADSKLIHATLTSHGFRLTQHMEKCNILWSSHIIKGYTFKNFRPHQRVNQFPRSYECTRKDYLSHNFNRMKEIHSSRYYSFMPDCFVLPKEREALQTAMQQKQCTWIVKPAGSACGRGIYLTNDFLQMPEMKEGNWIVSEYIDNPLLLDGHKFDLRIYVAVTSFYPLRIYVHEEGLCRLASHPYTNDPRLFNNHFIHLTNYAINKKNSRPLLTPNRAESSAEATRNKLSFSILRQKLESLGVDHDRLWASINDIIIKTLISIEEKVTPAVEQFVSHRNICFQMFGFDILVDNSHNPWLMEVNFAPSLNTDSELDLSVKSKVISDLFNLAGVRDCSVAPSSALRCNPYTVPMDPLMPEKLAMDLSLRCPPGKSRHNRPVVTREQRILQEALEEEGRAGGFKRIYPSPTSFQYLQFFISNRPLNVLLTNKLLEAKASNHQKKLAVYMKESKR
mmetsp:Transcript_4981/g.6845  ORF Transcript_4981/g.6845 Transcript_4981/m.6845 type:complete len:631 (+) Transcript_4981:167-2059(+)